MFQDIAEQLTTINTSLKETNKLLREISNNTKMPDLLEMAKNKKK